jgi:hypothetical protein
LQYYWFKKTKKTLFAAGIGQGLDYALSGVIWGTALNLLTYSIVQYEAGYFWLVPSIGCLMLVYFTLYYLFKEKYPIIYNYESDYYSIQAIIGYLKKPLIKNIIVGSSVGLLILMVLDRPFMLQLKLYLILLIIAIVYLMMDRVISNAAEALQITTPYQRFIASAKALHFSILQHWLLRWQLKRAGVLPWDVIGFLNEMTARHLLETDGATWRFRHRILQEYFAGQWHAEGTAKQ